MNTKTRTIILIVSLFVIGIALAGQVSDSKDISVLWKRAPGAFIAFLINGIASIYFVATTQTNTNDT